ncbi:hypothetical protein [Polaromonas hydrogenivorans]|uniref:Uncharacterized protein n=1 Tax=Polaromonas hydrogenivorans TaxID=335476 RepID=A0AAU7LY31_9BURK
MVVDGDLPVTNHEPAARQGVLTVLPFSGQLDDFNNESEAA